MRMIQLCRGIVSAAATTILLMTLSPAMDHPENRIEYWHGYGGGELLPAEDSRVDRADRIFNRLLQAAGGANANSALKLFITKRDPSKKLPRAIDGWIILSRETLDLCYHDQSQLRGEARLAFIMGHEIAHLLNGDARPMRFFWGTETNEQKDTVKTKVSQAHELEADAYGILYTAIAGFDTQAIVTEDTNVNFFTAWVRTRDPSHPDPETRAKEVIKRLREIIVKAEVFNLGIWFYQVGDYPRAVNAFRDFLQTFPSPEVYHNLAASHHQLAMRYACEEGNHPQALLFQLSVAIDPVTRASMISLRGELRGTSAEEHMTEAIQAYRKAIALDPDYVLAYINLGAALIQEGNATKREDYYHDATGMLLKANRIAKASPMVHNNLGVAYFHIGALAKSKEHLHKARELTPSYGAPLFNLGQIVYEQGRQAATTGQQAAAETWKREAQDYWDTYLQLDPTGPWANVIRKQREPVLPCGRLDLVTKSVEAIGDLQVGVRERDMHARWGAPTEVKEVPGLTQPFAEPLKLALYPHGITVLLEFRRIQMIGASEEYVGTSAKGIAVGSSEDEVYKQYGRPTRTLHVPQGVSWVYDTHRIAFLIRDGKIASWLLF